MQANNREIEFEFGPADIDDTPPIAKPIVSEPVVELKKDAQAAVIDFRDKPLIFSILTTKSTNQCKTFSLSDEGMLTKRSFANAHDGTFKVYAVRQISELSEMLDRLTAKQSLILGTPYRNGFPMQVGETINLTTKDSPKETSIPRSKDSIKYPENQSGFLLFDIDGNGTYEQVLEIIPEIESCATLCRPSSSSFIYDSAGNEIVGAKGWHIYVAITNIAEAPRLAEIFWQRQWLHGYGHYVVSKGLVPKLLERGIFDKAVLGAPERLAFEAMPTLDSGLENRNPPSRIIEGGYLDPKLIQTLPDADLTTIKQLKCEAKQKVKPTYELQKEAAKQAYIAKSELDEDEAVQEYTALTHRRLPDSFLLYTIKGDRYVGDLTGKDDGLTMCDPLEPDYDGGSKTKAKFFWNAGKPIIHSQAHGGCNYTLGNIENEPESKLITNDWGQIYSEHVESMNKWHAKVLIGGKYRIMRTVRAAVSHDKKETLEFFNESDLASVHRHKTIQVGFNKRKPDEPVFNDEITAWAKHPNVRNYRGGVVFSPNAPETDGYYNTWRGFAVEPVANPECLKRIYHHIEKVICKNDMDLVAYVYNWIAYTFQYPEKPAGAALVCRGEKGTGKGLLGHFLESIWGNHGTHISNAKHLIGNFNGHLADCCFLFADEAFFSGDRQHEGVLKALITEPCVMVERKGIDAIKQPNYLKIFMATNSEFAVPASRDERRYCVLDADNCYKGDKGYFDNLVTDCHSKDIQAAFLYDVLNRDITNFHTGQIPESDGLKDQRLHSLCSAGKWLADCLITNCFRDSDNSCEAWYDVVPAHELYKSYLYWCDKQRAGEYSRVSQTAFGRYLTKVGFVPKRTAAGIFRRMLDHDTALALFEDHEKITLQD